MEQGSPGQEFVQPPPRNSQTYQSSRGRQGKITDKMEGFIDLKRKKKVESVPDLPLHLSQPELGHQDLVLKHGGHPVYTPSVTNQNLKSEKAFQDDGPTVIPQSSPMFHYEDPFKKLGVVLKSPEDDLETLRFPQTSKTKPVGKFYKGSVKYTTLEGLKQMLQEVPTLRGNHGCIVDENFQPECDRYDQDIHYVVDRNIGKGSNGTADLCYDSSSGKPFVMKKILKASLRSSEVLMPLNLNHENVTKFYGLMQREERAEDGSLKMTMELMIEYGGKALNHLLLSETLAPPQIWELTRQGLGALQHLDYFGMIHLDVKPENVCVSRGAGGLVLKLTDFGSAKFPQEAVTCVGWTPEYMAPESCQLVLQHTKESIQYASNVTEGDITGRVDVFALALVVMYMYKRYHVLLKVVTQGRTTYTGFTAQQRQRMQFQLMYWLSTNEDLVQNLLPDECELDMRELLSRMTTHNPAARLTAAQALELLNEREAKSQKLRVPITPQEPVSRVSSKRSNRALATAAMEEDSPDSPAPESRHLGGDSCLPDIAATQIEMPPGPVKMMTKDKLRRKLQKPYRSAGKGKSGKRIASKELCPQTPVQEMEMLTLAHQPRNTDVQKTEKTSPIIAQATDDVERGYTEAVAPVQAPIQASLPPTLPALDMCLPDIGRKPRGRRANKTENVPQLRCEPEAMDVAECRYEMKPRPNPVSNPVVNPEQPREKLVSLANAAEQINLTRKLQLLMALKQQGLLTFGSTNKTTLVSTEESKTAMREMQPTTPVPVPTIQAPVPTPQAPEPAAPGNLPNLDVFM